MRERPSHADSLDEILATSMRLFSRGVADRRRPFRTPTLATTNPTGRPSLRTVVLRGFNPATRCITIHTDRRSPKIHEIRQTPQMALHVYDPGAANAAASCMTCCAKWPKPLEPKPTGGHRKVTPGSRPTLRALRRACRCRLKILAQSIRGDLAP